MPVIVMGTLGTGDYNNVLYRFSDGKAIQSSYPIHALIQRDSINPDRTIILTTKGARDKNWEVMEVFLRDTQTQGTIEAIDIPDGKNEAELWEIFRIVADQIPEKAQLYLDVTHGLRSLPILVLIVASYLRAAKNITIRSISYGAFELGKRETRGGKSIVTECDVFELLPFVTLFDWSSGVDAFKRTGDPSPLASLLRQSHKEAEGDTKAAIGEVASSLEQISIDLELARPEDAMTRANNLQDQITSRIGAVGKYAQPFNLLGTMLRSAFKTIALPENRTEVVQDRISAQRQLIQWYLQRRRYTLASLLAREWVVSRYMQQVQHERDTYDPDKRDQAERALRGVGRQDRFHEVWRQLKLPEIRNEIAHAGQSDIADNLTSNQLRERIEKVVEAIKRL